MMLVPRITTTMLCFLCFYDPIKFITVDYKGMNGAVYIIVAIPIRTASLPHTTKRIYNIYLKTSQENHEINYRNVVLIKEPQI